MKGLAFNCAVVLYCSRFFISLAVSAMSFVWKYLPVFIIWLTGLSMMDTALHQVTPPLGHVSWLAVLPLAVSLVLLAFVCRKEHGMFHIRGYLLQSAILSGVYLIPLLRSSSEPLAPDTHRLIYEASALVEFTILVLHGRTWLKGHDWAWIFGITSIFGMILENGGILMGFFREEGYLLYLPGLPAPIATMAGWVSVLYCGFFSVQMLLPDMRPMLKGFVCAGIALSMDIPFDPVATRLSWWVWNDSLVLSIWGVPAVNFVAWFWALFPYAWCFHAIREKKGMGEGKKMALFSALIPVILAVELSGVVMSLMVLGDAAALQVVVQFFRRIVG